MANHDSLQYVVKVFMGDADDIEAQLQSWLNSHRSELYGGPTERDYTILHGHNGELLLNISSSVTLTKTLASDYYPCRLITIVATAYCAMHAMAEAKMADECLMIEDAHGNENRHSL